MSLAKIDNWDEHKEALRILDEIIKQATGSAGTDSDTQAPPGSRKTDLGGRFEMLARSARASALVFEIEESRARPQTARSQKYERSVFSDIKDQRDWIRSIPASAEGLDWQAYALSYAVVQNAFGRACYVLGRHSEAIGALLEAVAMKADFADAHVNLAQVYLKRKSHLGRIGYAEDHFKEALRISPSNQKAHFLLGKLYADPAVARYEDAKAHLREADLWAWSHFHLAEILDREDDNLEGAIHHLRRSIFLSSEVDHRFEAYVRSVLRFTERPEQGEQDRLLLQDAQRVAGRLKSHGQTQRLREAGADLLQRVEDRLGRQEGQLESKPVSVGP